MDLLEAFLELLSGVLEAIIESDPENRGWVIALLILGFAVVIGVLYAVNPGSIK
jgi:hypothetical protein